MSETAIRAINITKEYTMDYSHNGSFKELLMRKIIGAKKPVMGQRKTMLALDDISFEVKKGEALGIIGKNGAGKSTLLKILSGITKPTTGKIEIYGRMGSILDIGVGFHPELTGRENIYLSGELNGLNRREIKKMMDEIIDFSGIEKFIDTPVKYYSSGMFLRLAFSVFTGIDSDILLLDEVMSVGDAEFQLKSARKLQSMFGQGKTVVLVSHNPIDISRLCNRVLVLENGRVKEDGPPGMTLVDYMEEAIVEAMGTTTKEKEIDADKQTVENVQKLPKIRNVVQWDDLATAPGNEFFRLRKIVVRNQNRSAEDNIYIDEKIIIMIEFDKQNESESINIALRINDINGNPLFVASPVLSGEEDCLKKYLTSIGLKTLSCVIQNHLFNSSVFIVDLFVSDSRKTKLLFSCPYLISFKTDYKKSNALFEKYKKDNHPILPITNWQIQ